MQTPFDSALRIQTRALDAVRISLLVETACEQALADERNALDTDFEREAAIAAIDWQVGVHPYGQRVRVRRIQIDNDRGASENRLNRLRDSAMEACGQMLAITGAAANFVGDLQRSEAAADQARADDLAGTRRGGRHDGSYRPPAMTAARAR